METQLEFKNLAPKAPGYILAPTTFLLDGQSDDFIDWDEETGLPEEDHWADDPNYWLLVFRAYPENKDSKSVILDAEICVDILGQHRCVPLSKHWGKDIRAPAPQSAGSILHAWGWRYPDSEKNPYDLYVHWILASPFQLAWSSLPPLNAKNRTCDWTTFEKWADHRGLKHTFLTTEELRGGKVMVPVASTWREGFARNRELVQAIDRLHLSQQKCNERFLYDLVDLALHQNSNILPHLKKAEFDAYGDKLTKEDRANEDRLIKESVKLNSFLSSKQYKALKQDAEATKEIGASKKLLVIMGRVFRRITEAPVVAKRLPEDAASITDYLKKHYDSKAAFKDSRKAAKSYWYLIKTFLKAADIKTGIPEWLIGPCNDFATKWYGQELKLVGQPKSALRVFDPKAVGDIKGKSTESVAHLRFFALLEGLNFGLAVYDRLQAKTADDVAKKSVALVGSMASLTSSLIDLNKAANKNWAQKKALGKLAIRPLTSRVLGYASSFADLGLGLWAVLDDLETHDEGAVKFHAAQAFGGALAVAGYLLLGTGVGAPIGALLVFLGSAAGFGGSLGANLFKTTDIEQWAKYCRWGVLAGKEGVGEENTSWADGVPCELYLQTAKQIRTLNTLLVGLRIDVTMVYSPKSSEAEVEVHVAMCSDEGSIELELIIQGVTVRKMSPWKHGKDRDQSGIVREKFPLGDGANVTARVRVKPFPETPYQVPSDKALEKKVVLVPPKGTLANPFLDRPY
jgi:hypothetical protein